MNREEIDNLKDKMGLNKISNINPPEDYSSIKSDAWYYVYGDDGMKGSDVIKRHISMTRVITWREHKEQRQRAIDIIEQEKQERQKDDLPF